MHGFFFAAQPLPRTCLAKDTQDTKDNKDM